MPLTIMNEAVKVTAAPITGDGRSRNRAAYFGSSARSSRIAAQAKAMERLVAPEPCDTPTRLGAVLMPIVPARPPRAQPAPSAITPPRTGAGRAASSRRR